MKILITTDCYSPVINGVVTSIKNLEQMLRKQGHQVKVLTMSTTHFSWKSKNAYYIRAFSAEKIYKDARVSPFLRHSYLKEIIEWKPDVIHSQSEFNAYLWAKFIKKQCGCPMIHTYHTVYEDYTHYFTKYPAIGKKVVTTGSRKLLKSMEAVIAPTQKVKNLLDTYGVNAQIHVVPTGIALEQYKQRLDLKEREALRQSLGLSNQDTVLITLGRVAKEKNIQEIIEYINENDETTPYKLLIVGDGPYRETLEEKVLAMGLSNRVIFAGMIPPQEVWKYYKLGDVFVSASQSETQGLTYIEAMASGLPLLCRMDQCLEGVIDQGIQGYTYTDKATFKQALNELLENPLKRQVMASAAMIRCEKFSAEAFGKKMEWIYTNAIMETEMQANFWQVLLSTYHLRIRRNAL